MKNTLFFVLFVFCVNGILSQNLVINPGLENWDSSTKPTGWTTSTKCTSEPAVFHTGILACMHSGSASSRGDLGQLIEITAGKTYTLSLYYLTGVPTTGVGARVWCYWKNSEGTSITDPATDDLLRSAYLSSPTWAQYSVNVTAPPGTTALYLEVRTYINSITYWDDFVLQESIATDVFQNEMPEISIYPNPAEDHLFIRNTERFSLAEIINLNGASLKTITLNNSAELIIPVNDLARGIYMLKLRNGDRTIMKKFIKE